MEKPHLTETILTEAQMAKCLDDLAAQIAAAHPDFSRLLLAGIQRRGADIAARLSKLPGFDRIPLASLDITLYRDDWTRLAGGVPGIGKSSMPCSPNGKIVILVDDVLYSGRTARSAMEAILDYGRPDKIELLAFIDRGHRELPISANYAGRIVETAPDQQVDVLLKERDGEDAVILRSHSPGETRNR